MGILLKCKRKKKKEKIHKNNTKRKRFDLI
jgi:hypothetical protein